MDPERVQPALAPTGDSRVDAAIERLATIGELELVRRPMVLEDVHAKLRAILGELGGPGGPVSGGPVPGGPVPGGSSRPGEPGRPGEQAELG
ncbi:MAG TPA: hypothetical protein VMI73_12425 [Trebonia sp.]|nr:hypothetical protein [Trebonia sp.]